MPERNVYTFMRRHFLQGLVLFALGQLAKAQTPPIDREFLVRMFDFDKKYDKFWRHLFACPSDPRVLADETSCKPAQGVLDYKLFGQAREAAKKLFDLDEPCPKTKS
jgi:hypothetical protein